MDIYIKSFNRPYLLHRCIASVYHFLNNFEGRIIILDDGTPQKYLDKIFILYPNIQIVKSPYYDNKSKAISLNKIPEKVIPADFWRDEVLKGSEYFILLEDDMWFAQPLNYKDFIKNVYNLKMDMIKFLWLKNEELISKKIINKTDYFNAIKPRVFTKNTFLFNAIFRTNKLKIGSIIQRGVSVNNELLKYYHIYIVAGGVFSKRYYSTCWKINKNEVDELQQISNLLRSKIDFNIGNSSVELLRTTLKTKATGSENNFNCFVFKLNKILNNIWFESTNDTFNFNEDISTNWIKKALESSEIRFIDWEKWYKQMKEQYEAMGCKLY